MVDGRWVRQRCAWCGKALIEEDLELVMAPVDQPRPPMGVPTWDGGVWVEVDEGVPTTYRVLEVEHDRFPVTACMYDLAPRLRMVRDASAALAAETDRLFDVDP